MNVYLVAAYLVFWGFTFVFVLSLWVRQRTIWRELETLKKRWERPPSSADGP